jgi:hypothetical protein
MQVKLVQRVGAVNEKKTALRIEGLFFGQTTINQLSLLDSSRP